MLIPLRAVAPVLGASERLENTVFRGTWWDVADTPCMTHGMTSGTGTVQLREDQLGKGLFTGSPKAKACFLWPQRMKLGTLMETTRSQISGQH